MKALVGGKTRTRLRALKLDALALYFALKDPRTPLLARALIALFVAYIFSPIDLLPDVIPFAGYIDEVILFPFILSTALRFVPDEVMAECREQARIKYEKIKPVLKTGIVIVLVIWLLMLYLIYHFIRWLI